MDNHDAILMIASSEKDSNMYYATHFLAPDPFIYIQTKEGKIVVTGDLEIDRAKAQSKADTVLSLSKYEKLAKERGIEEPSTLDVLNLILSEMNIEKILVPSNFGIEPTDFLRGKGYRLDFKKEPFFEERALKSKEEVEYISQALRAAEDAMDAALETIRGAGIKDGYLYQGDLILTSEEIKRTINVRLMEDNCTAGRTIVACGDQACDPHNEGSGPLKAHQPIVIDIFPRSLRTRYHGDITRTVVKGSASDEVKKIYDTVVEGQDVAFGMIRDGAVGTEIHRAVLDRFEKIGYRSGEINGRMQGFFHGTGHGLGLDVHEPPRIGKKGDVLKTGHVVTVEPGLYYLGVGGVRIEDVVVVMEDGYENLTKYPKQLTC